MCISISGAYSFTISNIPPSATMIPSTFSSANIFTNSFINQKYYMEKGVNVYLMGIDFLKVAHHGSNNSSGEEFLSKIYPKNAIISVDGNNIYGHPSTDLLKRLYFNNSNLNLFRTDVCGSVSVKVDDGGNYRVLTDIDFN